MIRIYLFLLIIIVLFLLLRPLRKTPPAALKRKIRPLAILAAGLFFIVLTATGHLNWLFALLGVGIAFLLRLMPALLHYAPQLHRLWSEFKGSKQNASQQQGYRSGSGKMSVEEAYEVLGLQIGASEQEIIAAHRRLMQKIHPDRGGSDYLAAKINLAKKILLKK